MIVYNKMGRLLSLVNIITFTFLPALVYSQAIFDEATEREQSFLKLATRVMETKLDQLAKVVEGQVTQKLGAVERMAMAKMDKVTENLTKDRKEKESDFVRNLTMSVEKQQGLVQILTAISTARAKESGNLMEITGDIMAAVKGIETGVVRLEGLGGTVINLTRDYSNDRPNRERATTLLRGLNESLSNIRSEQHLLRQDLVAVKNSSLAADPLFNTDEISNLVQGFDLMFKQLQKFSDPNQNIANTVNLGIVDYLNDSRAILQEQLTTTMSTLHTVLNQTNQAVSLSTSKMAQELDDLKKKFANILRMEQSIRNSTLLFENKILINEKILSDIRNLTLSVFEQLPSRNETHQLMTLFSEEIIRQLSNTRQSSLTNLTILTNFTTGKSDVQGMDCADILKKYPETRGKSDVYTIIVASNKTKQVYCDMSTNDGGWTVVQRRVNGSVDFYRNWTEYRDGFGSADNEYWIGNEILHQLTSQRSQELRVDMQRFNGEKAYALYNNFSVGDESSKYQLNVQGYSGNAGDSLIYSNTMKFSTLDQDNDKDMNQCSTYWKTAGWFKSCFYANPNGQYTDSEKKSWKNIVWYYWKNSNLALKNIQFMIRPRT